MPDLISPAFLDVEKVGETGFKMDRVLTIISAHFIHDTYSAFLAPLLPNLIEKLSLTYTQAGSLSAITQLPSLLNPIIGYLDDKVNLRIFVILAPAISATTMSCLGIAPNYLSLVILLFITGLSISAFHAPSPAMVARASGGQVGRGMSVYMAAGELGRTIGPLLASWGLLTFTLGRMLPIAIPGWIASLAIILRFKGIPVHVEKQVGFREVLPTARRLFLPLIGIIFFRSFLTTSLGVYLPTLLEGEGASIWKAGSTLAIYQFAGVVGAILGGTTSDRLGRKPVLFMVTLLAPIMVLVFLKTSGWLIIPVLILSGLFGLSSQPIILAIVQDQLPNHRSVGNGLFMALNFICLSIAAIGIGMLGDRMGLRQAFLWTAISGLIASPLVFLLPRAPNPTPELQV
ncbi:MAG: MFS transporter [Anaerolineales bacterium]|jgi:FSR family fosmidomycin resistance protein-like MFS transporter